MYVRPISTRLLRGMLTPEIRAKVVLPLTLLVTRVRADHQHAPVPADDLALLAHRLDRRSYLHAPFRLMIQTGWLWRPGRPPLPVPRTGNVVAQPDLAAQSATQQDSNMPEPLAVALLVATALPGPVLAHDSRESSPATSVGAFAGTVPGVPSSPGPVAYERREGPRRQVWRVFE